MEMAATTIFVVLFVLAIAGISYLVVLWVRGTRPIIRVMLMKGKWGFGAQPCPRCGSALPRLHTPKPLKQGGSFNCPNCGCEVDQLGREIHAVSDDTASKG
jgi:hypothetical protein